MRKNITKVFLLFVLLLPFVLVGCTKTTATSSPTTVSTEPFDGAYVYLHYYRYQADYSDWDLWGWAYKPVGKDGAAYSFTEDNTEDSYGGVVCSIPLSGDLEGCTQIGFIIRKGGDSWTDKDISSDRYIIIPDDISKDNPLNVYVIENEAEFGYSLEEAPDKTEKFTSAYFSDTNKIYISATGTIAKSSLELYKNDSEVAIAETTLAINGFSGTITIGENVDYNAVYTLKGTFSVQQTINVTFQGLYDNEGFIEAFAYDGDDLGAIVQNDGSTTFRVWAPVSSSVKLNLYSTGTILADSTAGHIGTDTPTETIDMTKSVKGTWYYESTENLHGTYYTYSVTNGNSTNEVVDPYAKSCGLNGERGLVVDFSETNPDGWNYDERANSVVDYTDSIIYEMHVRDFSIDDTWDGDSSLKGTYLALAETGTTYDSYTTGFDHLKEMGVTSVQILPFFDWSDGVDESQMDSETSKKYSWGYMPLNYNCLEGSYSSDPWDGLSRITEFKEVVMAYTAAGIRINMDVVYNHTAQSGDSNFNLIVPGYYYRLTTDGAFSNGSGCGNETASERYMMRKFILDSTEFWATEYNISGFRFDLMGLEDIETMNEVSANLHSIDSTITVYGEPWTGGTSTLASSDQAIKTHMSELTGVAAFNDNFRNGVKGSVFDAEAGGYVEGVSSSSVISAVKNGILGKFSETNGNPSQVINYVACHDNNTLHDKLVQACPDATDREILTMAKQAYSFVLLSQGISFIHAGDEFLRAKVKSDGTYDSNSYNSGDEVNGIDWSLKETNIELCDYIEYLISFRNEHTSFKLDTNEEVSASITFLETTGSVIAYTINNSVSNDSYGTILVIFSNVGTTFALPTGADWNLCGEVTVQQIFAGGSPINLQANETYVFYHS
ncbi:MAG: type I pullulanase [Bacillales bacterium]|nr:type I pullulanase [Bacillales bacterium]